MFHGGAYAAIRRAYSQPGSRQHYCAFARRLFRCSPASGYQPFARSADERAAGHIKAQRLVHFTRQSNACRDGNRRGFLFHSAEPETVSGAQVDAIKGSSDTKRHGQPPRPAGEIPQAHAFRRACINGKPSNGSMARISTPAPMPSTSLDTLNMYDTP